MPKNKKTDYKKMWRKSKKENIELNNKNSHLRDGFGKLMFLLNQVADRKITVKQLKNDYGYGAKKSKKLEKVGT